MVGQGPSSSALMRCVAWAGQAGGAQRATHPGSMKFLTLCGWQYDPRQTGTTGRGASEIAHGMHEASLRLSPAF